MDQFTPRVEGEARTSGESHGSPHEVAHGTLFPRPGSAVDPTAVIDVLHALRALAAVAGDDGVPQTGASRDLVVLIGTDDRVVTLADDGRRLVPGPSLSEVASRIAEATGLGVDLGAISLPPAALPGAPAGHGAPTLASAPTETPPRPGGVLLGALTASSLPVLARRLGAPVEVWPLEFDGRPHHLVRTPHGDLHLHRFGAVDLPVLALSRLGDSPYLSVLTAPGHLPGAFLSRIAPWLPALSSAELAHLSGSDAATARVTLAWFADPHRAPDSDLTLLANDPYPRTPLLAARLDRGAVAAAVQSEEDAGWSRRVLTALGAPTVLADVHEGRIDLGPPQVIEPIGAVRDMLRVRHRPLGRDGGPARHHR